MYIIILYDRFKSAYLAGVPTVAQKNTCSVDSVLLVELLVLTLDFSAIESIECNFTKKI